MLALTVVFGAIIGSFLSVCIYRIPFRSLQAADESEVSSVTTEIATSNAPADITIMSPPRSFCPSCNKSLLWWQNIPVISWILLRGRCHFCKERISVRYPVVELLSALSAVLALTYFGPTLTAVGVFVICATMIVISFIDYDHYIIPNVISLPGTAIGLGVIAINQFTHLLGAPFSQTILDSLLGILSGAGFLFVVSEIYLRVRKHEGLGMGDIKLLALVGAFFGVSGALYTIFVGSLMGAILGVVILIFSRKGLSHPLPFGPYLAIGTILYMFFGYASSVVPLLPTVH